MFSNIKKCTRNRNVNKVNDNLRLRYTRLHVYIKLRDYDDNNKSYNNNKDRNK